jgi:hypothetical protein
MKKVTCDKCGTYLHACKCRGEVARLRTENAALRKEVEGLRCCGNCEYVSTVLRSKCVHVSGYRTVKALREPHPSHVCDHWQPARGKG